MGYQWELFKVGMRRAEWMGIPDGMRLEWNDVSGLVLFVFYNNPSEEDMKDVSAGSRFEIAFKDIDGIGFFTIKFGDQPWADCCFSPNLYDPFPKFDKPEPGKTYALHIMLIDSAVGVGELKLLRSLSLGKEFAEHFRLWCLDSMKKNISRYYYDKVIKKVYDDYPTPEDLANAAELRFVGTHSEEGITRELRERE